MTEAFSPFLEKMTRKGLSKISIEVFREQYRRMLSQEKALLGEADISPVENLQEMDQIPACFAEIGQKLLSKTVMIKLNGGLGTSMGLAGAKSILKIREDKTFLDIIAMQSIQSKVHVIMMNSFSTIEDTEKVIKKYKHTFGDLFSDFVQNQIPKIDQNSCLPVAFPTQPELEWCPPGHGDLYTALLDQNILSRLRQQGKKWAFISNADNLGATICPRIIGYLHEQKIPFLMEVAHRTDADRKGGHLAISNTNGQLLLRERAQCPSDEESSFQNIDRYRYFNTNNLWIDLDALWSTTSSGTKALSLPLILNRKTVDPRDSQSPAVIQIETAVGAAIAVIPGANALAVPRSRFAPVKTTSDLLLVQSDLFELNDRYELIRNPKATANLPSVQLDSKFFGMIDHFEDRFANGVPSLYRCQSLRIEGDVFFGKDVSIVGHVTITNSSKKPFMIPDGTVISANILK